MRWQKTPENLSKRLGTPRHSTRGLEMIIQCRALPEVGKSTANSRLNPHSLRQKDPESPGPWAVTPAPPTGMVSTPPVPQVDQIPGDGN